MEREENAENQAVYREALFEPENTIYPVLIEAHDQYF